MTAERGVRALAGVFVLLSLGLGVEGSPIFVNANWLWFTVFVGANLLQSGLTGFCPALLVLRKCGLRDGSAAQPAP
ncbi:MAG TPA: DUF2892 domain-containing protein [Anaeromyxobacter sp.]|nr:DUF2892 domain-containing protein [Anaeromyxobacter sp.]